MKRANPQFFQHHVVGPLSTNCFIISEKENEAILLDPGGPEAVDIVRNLKQAGIEIKHVLATHGHFDHLGWATEVQKYTEGAKVYLHEDEKENYQIFQDWMPRFGLPIIELREPDVWIKDKDIIKACGLELEVIHTPGHSPGSVVYKFKEEAYVGDCISKVP